MFYVGTDLTHGVTHVATEPQNFYQIDGWPVLFVLNLPRGRKCHAEHLRQLFR